MSTPTLSPGAAAVLAILQRSNPKALTLSDIWDNSELENVDAARAAIEELQGAHLVGHDRDGRGRVFYRAAGSISRAPPQPPRTPPTAAAAAPAKPSPAKGKRTFVQSRTVVPAGLDVDQLLAKATQAPKQAPRSRKARHSPLQPFLPVIEQLKAKGYDWGTMASWFAEAGITCSKHALANVYGKARRAAAKAA